MPASPSGLLGSRRRAAISASLFGLVSDKESSKILFFSVFHRSWRKQAITLVRIFSPVVTVVAIFQQLVLSGRHSAGDRVRIRKFNTFIPAMSSAPFVYDLVPVRKRYFGP